MIRPKIEEMLRRYDMLSGGTEITVACSGGADSAALLDALISLREKLHITVSAAHYNHGIRGGEADRDELFVRELCGHYGIELTVGRGDVPVAARARGESLELAARRMRYAFLEQAAGDGLIATAHTASDNLETVLFHLTRGTGADGLCGIPPVRGRIIRPLLGCTREEIEAYCGARGLSYVTDSTNLSDDYTRNRLRHLVIPQLKAINPAVEQAAARCCAFLREDCAELDDRARVAYAQALRGQALDTAVLNALAPAVAKRVLRLFCAEHAVETDAYHLERLFEISIRGGRCSLPGGLSAWRAGERLQIGSGQAPDCSFSVSLSEKTVDFSKDPKKIHNLLLNNALDCDKIVGKLELRTRRPGDRFLLRRGGGTKTLKKLYNEYRIPLCERENLPVLCDERGIVWIHRIGTAERCAVGLSTRRILQISVVKEDV